jgi:hypothetical protein
MRPVRTTIAAAIAFWLAVLPHYNVLDYWFTGDDTIPLIETSRITSGQDLITIVTSPLLYGTRFAAEFASFYRPLANISYAFDYWVWGLDPFGYHLTDLFLHATVAALVVAFVSVATDDDLTGLLAGCLFAIHPITAEIVSVSARRHDSLATVFLLCSLLLLLKRQDISDKSSRRYLGGSVLAYLLALASKEVAMLLPGLVALWLLLTALPPDADTEHELWDGARTFVPYVVVTFGYFTIRVLLLGGIGGYERTSEISTTVLIAILTDYVLSLIYPVDLFGVAPVSNIALVSIFVAAIVGTTVYIAFQVGGLRSIVASRSGRLVVFSGAWMMAHVPLFLMSPGRYTPRHGYVPLVPFAAITAVALVVAGRNLRSSDNSISIGAGSTVIAVSLLVVSLLAVSPLIHSYDDWECAGEISESALRGAADGAHDLPSDAVIAIVGIPVDVERPQLSPDPGAKTVSYFRSYTVASWIRLQHPDSRVATYPAGPPVKIDGGAEVTANVTRLEDKQFPRLLLEYESRPNCNPD